MKKLRLKKDEVLVLKKITKDYTSNDGKFKWKKTGVIEAPDWDDSPECGGGIHGLEWGAGSFDIENYGELFVVLRVKMGDGYVDLGDKVKFRKGRVILVTESAREATDIIREYAPKDTPINYAYGEGKSEVLGYRSVTNQGDLSTANQGYESAANQGHSSAANQGHSSTANQGDYSAANQGDYSAANQGHSSAANQGDESTANQGDESTANQGDESTANQGDESTANQGHSSAANQGDYSTATIYGDNAVYRGGRGSICVLFFNGSRKTFESKGKTLFIENGEVLKRYSHTPERITKLEPWEVFVFGSNLAGNHTGGAAKLAKGKFGADEGVGEGLVGQSYAFPTLDREMKPVSEKAFKKSIEKLLKTAYEETRKIFLVTKVGCGIAGFDEETVKGYWEEYEKEISANVILPKGWLE